MTWVSWQVPIEAVRASADDHGAVTLPQLVQRHAVLRPHARVELAADRFIATVTYQLPGYVERTETAPVTLAWAPQENAA